VKVTRRFGHEPASVPAARHFAVKALEQAPPDVAETVELMVSELVTNCIRHTGSGFELTITRCGQEIRVEATDGAGGQPAMKSPAPTDPFGRGLRIVDMLSQDWGVQRTGTAGKTVWFTLSVAEAA
jgi:anti-sigma regulatory factor (Ser/Thr protein kinase)